MSICEQTGERLHRRRWNRLMEELGTIQDLLTHA